MLKWVGASMKGAESAPPGHTATPWFGSGNGTAMQGDFESRISIKSGNLAVVVAR